MRDLDYMKLFWPKGFRAALLGLALLLGTAHALAQQKPAASSPARNPLLTVEQAQGLVRSSPNDPSAYLQLGSAYRRARKYDDALKAFQKMATLAPNASVTHVSLGAVYMDLNRPKDAYKSFQKAI